MNKLEIIRQNKISQEIISIIEFQIKKFKDAELPVPKEIPSPKRLFNSFNEPTKKALKYNRKLIRDGKTFAYLDIDKFYNPKTDAFFKPKRDKRYKNKIVYLKKFKDLEKMGQVLVTKSFENKTVANYDVNLYNKLNELRNNIKDYVNSMPKTLATGYKNLTPEQRAEFEKGAKILESEEILVDLKKISWFKVLEILQQVNDNIFFFKGRATNSNSWITFSQQQLEKLQDVDALMGNDFKERLGSDNEFIFNISKSSTFIIKVMLRREKGTDNGAFFKYYHNLENLTDTLEKEINSLGIYNKAPINRYIHNNNCLYNAFKELGLEKEKLNAMKEYVKCGAVPISSLEKIANKLSIHIELKRSENTKGLFHYGDKNNDTFKINLVDNHYFIDKKINITSFSLLNYEEIKDIKDYFKIDKKREKNGKVSYEKTNKKDITSFRFVKILLENKDILLKQIPVIDIMKTPYYNDMIDNNNLDFNPMECCDINETIKSNNKDAYQIFFDFETDTSRTDKEGNRTKHVPYLMSAITEDNKIIKRFGEDCGKHFLGTIKNQFKDDKPIEKFLHKMSKDKGVIKEVQLIAHNCRYDLTFLLDHLSASGLNPVLNGNRLMGGSAKIFINNHKDRHQCDKKCKKDCKNHNKVQVRYKDGDDIRSEYITPYIKLIFQDSYNLISKPLRDFSKMFKLDSQKEILPYDLYTKNNINKKYVDINECLSFVKKEDHLEYLKNCKKWKCLGYEGKIDIIKYSMEYCVMDCKVLKDGYNLFKSWIDEVCDLNIVNYCSIASLSMDYLIKEDCFNDCWKLAGRPRDFIQKCVVGGRTMCRDNKKWRVEGKINDFDAVSLYPSAMVRMKGFLKGMPKQIEKENLSVEWLQNETDGYFVKVMCKNNAIKHGFPVLSNTNLDGIREFTNNTEGEMYYLDKTMLEDAVNFQGLDFDIICGYYYDEGHNDKINSVMEHLFKTRLEAKNNGNPIQEIYKLLMNSSYGKSLLKPIETDVKIVSNNYLNSYISKKYNFIREWTECENFSIIKETKVIDDHYNNCYAGVEVLSMSKRIMNEVMCLAEDKKLMIYYQDTDSMHINDKDINILEKEFRFKYNRELIGKDMGQFHSDFDLKNADNIVATKSIFLGKKSYLDILEGTDKDGNKINGIHTRMKGINIEGIKDYAEQKGCSIENIYDRLYDDNTLWDDVNGGKFDLLASGKKVKFQYDKDMSVKSCSSFMRGVNFKYEKGIIC